MAMFRLGLQSVLCTLSGTLCEVTSVQKDVVKLGSENPGDQKTFGTRPC